MLVLLSNLNLVTRVEIPVTATVQNTCLQGSWVKWDGSAKLTGDATGGAQIWTEASRASEKLYEAGATAIAAVGTPRFTPDATSHGDANGQLTVLYGKYRAATNLFSGAPSIGQYLRLDSGGLLEGFAPVSGSSQDAIAVCTKVKHKYTHIGTEYEVIEYVTI